jgi:hypothetical protein
VKYVRANASLDATDKTNKVFLSFCSYVDNMLLFWCLQDRMYSGYETGMVNLVNAICQEDHLARYNDFLKEMGIDRHIVARRAVDGSLVLIMISVQEGFFPMTSQQCQMVKVP